ncbi:MAG TPA: exopolyphosphatase [Gammaproteobacteria bacterium]|nr:exopolyphosphatase [Gammaproteobacteria bacterium]
MPLEQKIISNTYAAIDLGSNSFHLAIGQVHQGELRWQSKMSEKVQLASGMDEFNCLNTETEDRALKCLKRFHKRIAYIKPENIRIVGTNALRVIRNSTSLLKTIEGIFKQRVDVISGREEARLIYLGVSQTSPENKESKLVIDIGGGSTEFIIGQHFQPLRTESLHMGCVSYKKRFFSDEKLSKSNFKHAISASQQEVQHITQQYQSEGWTHAMGASGSVKSIFNALKGLDKAREYITQDDLQWLVEYLLKFDTISEINIPNLKPERNPIFPSGLCILYGAMKQLNIDKLYYSEGALREGLIYDLLGRHEPENVRQRTVTALQQRFSIDIPQAQRVLKTSQHLHESLCSTWPDIHSEHYKDILSVAAELHEIGLCVSHSQFHKHGAYILTYADLAGFSRQEQSILGSLVRLHRRKFALEACEELTDDIKPIVRSLAIILRLSVLLHHARSQTPGSLAKHIEVIQDKSDATSLTLKIDEKWLMSNPLILEDLKAETKLLKKSNFSLSIVIR